MLRCQVAWFQSPPKLSDYQQSGFVPACVQGGVFSMKWLIGCWCSVPWTPAAVVTTVTVSREWIAYTVGSSCIRRDNHTTASTLREHCHSASYPHRHAEWVYRMKWLIGFLVQRCVNTSCCCLLVIKYNIPRAVTGRTLGGAGLAGCKISLITCRGFHDAINHCFWH